MLNHLFQPRVHVLTGATRENFILGGDARCTGASLVFQLTGLYIMPKLFNFDIFTLLNEMNLGIGFTINNLQMIFRMIDSRFVCTRNTKESAGHRTAFLRLKLKPLRSGLFRVTQYLPFA